MREVGIVRALSPFLTSIFLVTALLVTGCTAPASDQGSETTATEPRLALYGVTVIDGTGAAPLPSQVVLLEGDRIVSIQPAASFDRDGGAIIVDLTGKFVVPGFIDLHVHFPPSLEPRDPTHQIHDAMLARLLEFGITTILNPGARVGAGVELRQRILQGEVQGPRMFTAGRIIDHYPASEEMAPWVAQVTSEEAIRQEIRTQASQGVDFIKLYQHLPPNLVQAAIEESHALGLPVIGHMGATTWGEAARGGIDMLVHSGWGTPMDEVVNLEEPALASDRDWYQAYASAPQGRRWRELAATLIAEDVVVVPTVSITQAGGLGRDASMLPLFRVDLAPEADVPGWWTDGWRLHHPQYGSDSEEEAELMATIYIPGVLNILRAYHEHGVRVGVGTDVGNSWMTPGFIYHYELALYQEAGIPPLEILKMVTHNGAEALGILDDVGTIEAGKRADLIILGSDPSQDILATRDITAVYLGGKKVDSP